MKSILLTRDSYNNYEIIKGINELTNNKINFNYIQYPLITYSPLPFNPKILTSYHNIIITSKYAANILAHQVKNNTFLNIWVVGETSKNILNHYNFKVEYSAKNIDDLIKHFPENLYNTAIYLSSNEITKALPSEIKRQIIYNVSYLDKIPNLESFKNSIDYILLYSQNSAQTLIKLLLQNNLLQYLRNTTVIAISVKVINIIRPFFKNVIYCDNDNHKLMIKLLIEHAKNSK